MNTMDARGVLADAIKRGRYGARKSGDKLAFRCPRHSDGTASAWLGDHAWGCSACGFTEGLHTLAETLGVALPESSASRGLTLTEYAERKGLALAGLMAAGVREATGKYGDSLLAIPYRRADGSVIRTKYRTRKGTFWGSDGEGIHLYGLDRLATATPGSAVVIVEGESDCHAAWQRGVMAIGLPGASQWKPEFASVLRGFTVYVWQEPDEGGATLVASVAKSLPTARVIREVEVKGAAIKDLGDLHQAVQAEGEDWATVWQRVLDAATPIGAEAPVVAFDSLTGATLDAILTEKLANIDAVPTMLPDWNALCRGGGGGVGFARSWMITIGANTGTGKSLIGLNLAAEAIKHGEVPTLISLEMGRSEMATRLMSIVSGESVTLLEQGSSFDGAAYERARESLNAIRRATGGHVLVNRRPISKLTDIVACVKHHVETFGSRYFIIDYLQLAWTANAHTIQERMELVSHQIREMTHQHNIVTVALSQFNRQTSAMREERPVAQGLMGGSAIENDSHIVALFDHSRFVRYGNYADTWLIIDKSRHGPVADLPVRWDYRTLRLIPRVAIPGEEPKETSTRKRGS